MFNHKTQPSNQMFDSNTLSLLDEGMFYLRETLSGIKLLLILVRPARMPGGYGEDDRSSNLQSSLLRFGTRSNERGHQWDSNSLV